MGSQTSYVWNMHRPKQACGKQFFLPRKWVIVTYVDNVPKVLSVIISKVAYNFWLVMAERPLSGRRAPVGTTWSAAGGGAHESRCTAHDGITTQSFGHLV